MNIVSAFLFQARYQPQVPALCLPGNGYNFVSYGMLAGKIYRISRHALLSGLREGETVAVVVADPVEHLALVLGLMRIGVVTFSTASQTLPTEFPIDAVVTDVPGIFNIARVITVDDAWTKSDDGPIAETHEDGASNARIFQTTGTTGEPRAIVLTHDVIMRRIQAFGTFAYGNYSAAHRRSYIDSGLYTAMGFALVMSILLRGGTAFLACPDAGRLFEAFSFFDVQFMIAAPAAVASLLDGYERNPGLVCPLRAIMSGGSAMSKSLSERVRQRMCSHLILSYGTTEMGAVTSALAHHIAHIEGATGYVLPGITVQACEGDGPPLAPGKEGIIRIRSNCGVAGYLGNPPGSQEIFRDGWFYPGDIGAVSEDGVLIVSGRQKTVLNIGGEKLHPEKVEQVLMGFPGIEQAGVFAVANTAGIDEVCAAIVCSSKLDRAALDLFCQQQIHYWFVPKRFAVVATLPRNAMCKLDRKRLSEFASAAKAPENIPGPHPTITVEPSSKSMPQVPLTINIGRDTA